MIAASAVIQNVQVAEQLPVHSSPLPLVSNKSIAEPTPKPRNDLTTLARTSNRHPAFFAPLHHFPFVTSTWRRTLLSTSILLSADTYDRRLLIPPMPGLIPFLPTPPLPQPTRPTSGQSVNHLQDLDRGAARGGSSQAPIELDDDSEPAQATTSGPLNATTGTQQQQQQQRSRNHAVNPWGILTPDITQHLQALPSFSDFAANLDFSQFDATAPFPNGAPQTPGHDLNSDEFLSALVDGNFSSPSSYPQQAQAYPGTHQPNQSLNLQNPPHRCPPETALRPNRLFTRNSSNNTPAAPPVGRVPTGNPTTFESEVEESLFVSSDDEQVPATMPVQTRRRASTILSSDHDPEPEEIAAPTSRKRAAPSSAPSRGSAGPKRRRTSQPQGTRTQTATNTLVIADDPFAEEKEESKKGKEKDEDIIDLAGPNEASEEVKVPKEDNRVKLSAFQCVICMDDVTALTVTHCGHLFCSECLHSALNVDATKNKCPICRQKVETKDRNEYTSKTKGFWPLELKLMTANRKGKQRA
ncbi:uncharacterized protein CLUP02_03179 [Colletotrichum lupini]|uniref:RING-type domain-containing protein n=1 Tax=Colletotrichum lupini TaxID=145971 RepID=A0A9Q8WBJ4_9PEZI|nr:uncharacterized protein CLUP02_03179 [Colletotrichum lupini]UQC77708.1 hypothetical protein CLUP02_03179 [Colletotrichum lupini]